jgi:phospholipase/carboxylesterase
MQTDLILQRPAAATDAELVLLFHGVGSSAEDLAPLGQMLGAQRPQAWVVSARSPHPCDLGQGWQWFSVQGVTDANRPQRVAAAMPAFVARVQAWQQETGVSPQRTTLLGFSQGAIMALESTQRPEGPALAHRVVAVAGRFAQAPRHAPPHTAVHLLHGEQDGVMPIGHAEVAEHALRSLGVACTLDRFAGLGHGIDARVAQAIAQRLGTPVAQPRP